MKITRLASLMTLAYLLLAVQTAAWSQTIQDGLKFIDNEQFLNAKKLFQNLVKQNPLPENYYYLGNTYLLMYDIDSADEYIDTAKMNFEMGTSCDNAMSGGAANNSERAPNEYIPLPANRSIKTTSSTFPAKVPANELTYC